MRSDEQLADDFSTSTEWKKKLDVAGEESELRNRMTLPSIDRGKMSFSGKEKNHLFINEGGDSFSDISGVSGVNTPQDSRSFAILDFDRDGWQDMALVSVNTPVFRLYKNQLGQTDFRQESTSNFVAVKLVGGNKSPQANTKWSCRDGYGAKVYVKLDEMTLKRELRCGEGLGAQNSDCLLFGLDSRTNVEAIEVVWPSGIRQERSNVSANRLITVFENAAESGDGSGFLDEKYLLVDSNRTNKQRVLAQLSSLETEQQDASQIQLLVAFSTTCDACAAKLPALSALQSQFTTKEVSIRGVSVDQNDDISMISGFVNKFRPVYTIETNWSRKEQLELAKLLNNELGQIIFPAVVVADKSGSILNVSHSVPTVSDIKKFLMELKNK